MLAYIWDRLQRKQVEVSVTLDCFNNVYTAVDAFVRNNSIDIPDLDHLYAFDEDNSDSDDDDDDDDDEGEKLPVVAFVPRKS